MENFDSLIKVAEHLLGPEGCPWDQKQTFSSLQPYVLEEAHEVIEAVDADDDKKIVEELGDLLYTIIFYGKLAEKSGRFSMEDIVNTVKEKLIRRHPHVFGEVKVKGVDDIMKNWEKIKADEKGRPKSPFEDIPPTLPTLIKAQKILKRILRSGTSELADRTFSQATEEDIGDGIIDLIIQAERNDIDAESALRRALSRIERST
jgi:MazG family protein